MARFRKGSKVVMTEEALENYGEEYRGRVLTVTRVATKYMPAKEFYARDMPEGYHPGYDESANGCPLYDVEGFNGSLYYWEVKEAE